MTRADIWRLSADARFPELQRTRLRFREGHLALFISGVEGFVLRGLARYVFANAPTVLPNTEDDIGYDKFL